jgi:hypothetical protein
MEEMLRERHKIIKTAMRQANGQRPTIPGRILENRRYGKAKYNGDYADVISEAST